jgi:hypothetical protein
MDLPTISELFITSKMNSFFGFRKTDKRKSLADEIIELKNYTIIRLNLTHEEILRTKQEHATFKEVIESFLFLYGHLAERLYPNISLSPLVINGHKFPSCIIIFQGKQPWTSIPPPIWYQKITNIHLQINEKWPYNEENDENDTTPVNPHEQLYTRENKRIFQRIYSMLVNGDISVRKIFDIGMKQSQARTLYKKLEELELFKVSYANKNKKFYFPFNNPKLTQQHIDDIMSDENCLD